MSAILWSCNNHQPGDKQDAMKTSETDHHDEPKKTGELTLNNGAKWKADSTTWLNVASLQIIVSGARKESPENFMQMARALENGLNKMVSECKMKGADHDALHRWLEPVIDNTIKLKNAKTTESGAVILSEIEKQLGLFQQYFE